MKIVLDTCIPEKLVNLFMLVEAHSVYEFGWQILQNGKLLSVAEAEGFDALVTVDKNIPFQQNMALREISLVVVHVLNNKIETVAKRLTEIEPMLKDAPKGKVTVID